MRIDGNDEKWSGGTHFSAQVQIAARKSGSFSLLLLSLLANKQINKNAHENAARMCEEDKMNVGPKFHFIIYLMPFDDTVNILIFISRR